MNSLDQLKQELLTQKTAITNKGGTVTIAHTNPSPAEITFALGLRPIMSIMVRAVLCLRHGVVCQGLFCGKAYKLRLGAGHVRFSVHRPGPCQNGACLPYRKGPAKAYKYRVSRQAVGVRLSSA